MDSVQTLYQGYCKETDHYKRSFSLHRPEGISISLWGFCVSRLSVYRGITSIHSAFIPYIEVSAQGLLQPDWSRLKLSLSAWINNQGRHCNMFLVQHELGWVMSFAVGFSFCHYLLYSGGAEEKEMENHQPPWGQWKCTVCAVRGWKRGEHSLSERKREGGRDEKGGKAWRPRTLTCCTGESYRMVLMAERCVEMCFPNRNHIKKKNRWCEYNMLTLLTNTFVKTSKRQLWIAFNLCSSPSLSLSHTYEQLAVELQVDVPVSRRLLRGSGELVEAKRCLFNVALGSNAMPPVVVQREGGLHTNLQRSVAHVKGEEDLSGGCVGGGGYQDIVVAAFFHDHVNL